jgi:hypothetical protein
MKASVRERTDGAYKNVMDGSDAMNAKLSQRSEEFQKNTIVSFDRNASKLIGEAEDLATKVDVDAVGNKERR